ncbi:MAG TPA: dephospho-CoA kinase [Bacteroidales bacterium]|nr:dephospho-CoA kinase [Bacteroidales bacterium]
MRKEKKPAMKLGITGGIGCGKTSVCRVFNVLGIPVFSADSDAREIMESNTGIIGRINTVAGKDLYKSGRLDRMELASLIFNDNTLLKKVNSLVHPVVFDHFIMWEMEQTTPYVIMEAAILYESGASELVDKVATVVAPLEERVERVIKRNNLSREQVLERIRNQMDDDIRIKLSDFVIYNSENDMIIPAILQIHDVLLKYINT